MGDPLGQSLLPFYTACARAFGPVMVQEFGTLLTHGVRNCDAYLRAMLPRCQAAGANGYLWWCLRDIQTRCHPYNKNAFEGLLGLVDELGQVKPGLRYFLSFARACAEQPPATLARSHALLWPSEYYPRDNPASPGNKPQELSRQLAIAHFCLESLGHPARIVRSSDLSMIGDFHTLLIAGAKLTATETLTLEAWVCAGGRLIWHGPDALTWGPETIRLIGAAPVDFRAPTPSSVRVFGRTWSFDHFPRDVFLELEPVGAEVLAWTKDGRPALLRHSLGKGCVVTSLALPEAQFAAETCDRNGRAHWLSWYKGMLKLSSPQPQTRKPRN